ncbi:MAG TPA: dihydrolipoamide acetyltransferase family protein [Candidatus Eisenbacteria bacterium]|nr:dihydrolipoamide acetyltransferase family protein [Candidatus Eisenbacteria bacterium]
MPDQVFRLPDLGEGLTEAQLITWRVTEGQQIEINAPLCEVETAKAIVVVPSPFAGTITQLHARPGQSVPVGNALVTIRSSTTAGTEEAPRRGVLVGYGPEATPESGIRRRSRSAPAPSGPGAEDVRAAPFVRQRARELGVDLARVVGTGPDGRVTRSDVEAAAQGSRVEADGDQRISVVGIRKAIARQMLRSVTTIPQFTEFAVFDATGLLADREHRKQAGQSVTPLPYFVRAVVRATRDHPMLNSTWDEAHDEIVVKRAIHVGLAVNTPQGLLVPVLRDADQLDLQQIAARASELIAGARAGSLPPRDMTGSTITVTNVGASGPVETGTPIINPPECCVVGFGAIRPRPMVIDGQVVARPGAWISISVDHRIVDGALATEFLTTLVRYLEEPVA